jgi:adenosylcobinamide-GDP ribazoletransferase
MLGGGFAMAFLGAPGAVPVALAALCLWGLARLARVRIGGQTGDILGAAQQLAEIALLLGLAALA